MGGRLLSFYLFIYSDKIKPYFLQTAFGGLNPIYEVKKIEVDVDNVNITRSDRPYDAFASVHCNIKVI